PRIRVAGRNEAEIGEEPPKMPLNDTLWVSDRKSGLRLAHLIAWTAGSALGLAAYRGLWPKLGSGAASWAWIFLGVYNLVMGAALGTILTGIGVMAYRRRR